MGSCVSAQKKSYNLTPADCPDNPVAIEPLQPLEPKDRTDQKDNDESGMSKVVVIKIIRKCFYPSNYSMASGMLSSLSAAAESASASTSPARAMASP